MDALIEHLRMRAPGPHPGAAGRVPADTTRRLAIELPRETYEALAEFLRRTDDTNADRAVNEALQAWLRENERREQIAEALKGLTSQEELFMWMHFVDQPNRPRRSVPEIAATLGTTVARAYQVKKSALARLRSEPDAFEAFLDAIGRSDENSRRLGVRGEAERKSA